MQPGVMTWDLNQSLLQLQNLLLRPMPMIMVTKSSPGEGSWCGMQVYVTLMVTGWTDSLH